MKTLKLSLEKALQLKTDFLYLENKRLKMDGVDYNCIALFVVPSNYELTPNFIDHCLNKFFSKSSRNKQALFYAGVFSSLDTIQNTIVAIGRNVAKYSEFKFQDFTDCVNENSLLVNLSKYQ